MIFGERRGWMEICGGIEHGGNVSNRFRAISRQIIAIENRLKNRRLPKGKREKLEWLAGWLQKKKLPDLGLF